MRAFPENRQRFLAQPHEAGFVYFIQMGEGGPIKIGWTRDPWQRIHELQTAQPYRLRLLGVIEGDRHTERRLHRELAEHRVRGEWFKSAPDVLAKLDAEGSRVRARRPYTDRGERCENCETLLVQREHNVCRACREFAEVRELAAQGVDPFE